MKLRHSFSKVDIQKLSLGLSHLKTRQCFLSELYDIITSCFHFLSFVCRKKE